MLNQPADKRVRCAGRILVVLSLVVALTGACTHASSTPSPKPAPSPASQAGGTQSNSIPSVGTCTEAEAVRLCAYTLRYYDKLADSAPQTGDQYVGIKVSLSSNSDDTTYAFPAYMSLVDTGGITYTIQLAGAMLSDGLTPEALFKGERATGVVVFEIPTTTTPAKFRAKALPKGPPMEIDLASLMPKGKPGAAGKAG
jgi:hypothetical protein